MNKLRGITKYLFPLIMLALLIAGCSDNDNDNNKQVAPSSAKSITAFSVDGDTGIVNETFKTIDVTVHNGTDVTALVPIFTSTAKKVMVGDTPQISGTTAIDFTAPVAYTVTAADGSTATYTVTVTVAEITDKALTAFSLAGVAGTIDEAAKTVTVTVPYGTDLTALVATYSATTADVKVGATPQVSGTTANDFTAAVPYTLTAADASTVDYTVTTNVALESDKALTAFSLNGVPGIINEGAKTVVVIMPPGTDVKALVATYTATAANVMVGANAQTSGTTANNFTLPVDYIVTAADASTATYTVTVRDTPLSSDKALTAFSVAGMPGTIDEAAKTVTVTVPFGTDVTALVPTYTTSGTDVTVLGTPQVSDTTANDFTAAVPYTVTAADASFVDYTVTVTPALVSDKALTAFSLNGVPGIINEGAKTINVILPLGTDVTNLIATYSANATDVKVGANAQTSGTTANDFTMPVGYTVTAADASTATYTVTVTLADGPAAVNLGTAGNFAIFANMGIDTAANASTITGDIGVGPAVTSTAITGFALTLPAASPSSTTPQVVGNVYAFDYADPTPAQMTTATADMGLAYADADSRIATSPATTNIGAGTLTSLTLPPGVYEWGSNVNIPTNLTLSGSATDIWIFKVDGTLDMAANKSVLLTGGALPENIFWQTTGAVTIGAGTHFEGNILSQTSIVFGNKASLNGRMLAQSAVTLDATTVVKP